MKSRRSSLPQSKPSFPRKRAAFLSRLRKRHFLAEARSESRLDAPIKSGHDVTLGIDCGGTNLKLALVNRSGDILNSKLAPIDFKASPDKVLTKMGQTIRKFLQECRASKVQGIGMGIAGDVDQGQGIVRFSPNLNWKNVAVKKALTQELKTPILVENDANAAAWGAYCLDAKMDCENLVCLTLGTGLGGGIVVGRKLYRGATGSAGEIGHMSIDYHGRACKCGSFGCIESYIGAWGLIQTAEDGLKKGLAPVLENILKDSRAKLDPKSIEDAAKQGDPFCKQLWRDAGEHLGCALANLVNIFNPERIILCGGVSKAGDLLLEPALHTLGRRAFAAPAGKVKVTVSKFDQQLGVVGAALLFWE